ncbi:alpha/beta fold hydrolase [Paenibacillus sp. sgz5001063]|uniref:alpha/beta fold hydrolase n=1 Tax=Paenibacillus sp. sgz5001063 TaxID=3242474 RepID=UPI0036D2EA2A
MLSSAKKMKQLGSFTYSYVISHDGTRIGYQSIGQGPGVLIIPGALSTSDDFTHIADELSGSFTVHIIDRRGRVRSGDQGADYSIGKECEDIQAVQEASGAANIFGHSFGGLAALEFGGTHSVCKKIAVYEPGVSIESNPKEWDWIEEYEAALMAKDSRGAFTSFVQGAGHTPLKNLPKWYANFILRLVIRGEKWEKIRRLLPACLNEHKEVRRLEATYSKYESIDAKVLLMAGGKSPQAVHHMIHVLEQTIPQVQSRVFPKLDHLSPENGEAPQEIAQLLKEFFS